MKQIKTSTGLIIIFAAAVILFGGAYTWGTVNSMDYSVSPSQMIVKKNTNANSAETADWKTYTNGTYNYSIIYPPADWTTSETDKPNVSFRNNKVNYGFNISVASSQLSLSDYVTSLKTEAAALVQEDRPGDTFGAESSTTIDGQTAVKIINCT